MTEAMKEPETLSADADVTQEDIDKALRMPSDFGYFGPNKEIGRTWALGDIIVHRDSEPRVQSNARVLLKKLKADKTLDGEWEVTQCGHWAVGWCDHLSFHAITIDPVATEQIKKIDVFIDKLERLVDTDRDAADALVLQSQSSFSVEIDTIIKQLVERRKSLEEQRLVPTRIFKVLKKWWSDLKEDVECNGGVADENDLDELAHELSIRHFPYICRNLIIDNPREGWESELYHELRDTGNYRTGEELYPSEDEVRPILKDLGLLKADESDSNADDSDSEV